MLGFLLESDWPELSVLKWRLDYLLIWSKAVAVIATAACVATLSSKDRESVVEKVHEIAASISKKTGMYLVMAQIL